MSGTNDEQNPNSAAPARDAPATAPAALSGNAAANAAPAAAVSSPLTPLAKPTYATHAKLEGGKELFQQTAKSRKIIANLSGMHNNTTSPIIDGRRALYLSVHRVFSAINSILSNQARRLDHVMYYDNSHKLTQDPELGGCLVIPRIGEYLPKLGITPKAIGDIAHVQTIYVDHMVAGRPVSANLVRTVYDVLKSKLPGDFLSDDHDLIN